MPVRLKQEEVVNRRRSANVTYHDSWGGNSFCMWWKTAHSLRDAADATKRINLSMEAVAEIDKLIVLRREMEDCEQDWEGRERHWLCLTASVEELKKVIADGKMSLGQICAVIASCKNWVFGGEQMIRPLRAKANERRREREQLEEDRARASARRVSEREVHTEQKAQIEEARLRKQTGPLSGVLLDRRLRAEAPPVFVCYQRAIRQNPGNNRRWWFKQI